MALTLALLAAACGERSLTDPVLETPDPSARPEATLLECHADVRSGEVRCAPRTPQLPGGAHGNVIVGGQDHYVRLSNEETSYDAGTELFTTQVRVQNLTHHIMGSSDGIAVQGVRVFFHSGPTATGGSGNVSVLPDGWDTFTAADQPYYQWAEMLAPMEMSRAKTWTFEVEPGVATFTFQVYVHAPLSDEEAPLMGSVWSGNGVSGDWFSGDNWAGGLLPDSTTAATIPIPARGLGPQDPVLGDDAAVLHLRVGAGRTLDLDGHTLSVHGNVDAPGVIEDGTVWLRGTSTLVGGSFPDLVSDGAVELQHATSVAGSLVLNGAFVSSGLPLTIDAP